MNRLVVAGMAEFEVPVTQCEVWAVTTAFDTDNSGQVKTFSLGRTPPVDVTNVFVRVQP